MLTIGKLASLAGTSTNTLRYYEREGLLAPAAKAANGYRHYPPQTVKFVRFILRARQCGFTLDEIRRLQSMPALACSCRADVRQLAIDKRQSLETQIATMQSMADDLDRLVAACSGGEQGLGACPILQALNGARFHRARARYAALL